MILKSVSFRQKIDLLRVIHGKFYFLSIKYTFEEKKLLDDFLSMKNNVFNSVFSYKNKYDLL